ncbi:MAG: sodium:proton antiporter [Dorea sp.]|nr:sodium:proton antiporter [Dorea sp.]
MITNFVQNVPNFSILFPMFAAILSSAVNGKKARKISLYLTIFMGAISLLLLSYTYTTGESFVYWMGHFPAPWGNEIRGGMLEALMAFLFSFITLISLVGGGEKLEEYLDAEKSNFYYIMVDLMLASNLALVYTNDMFTAYVFVEINTIAACGLIISKDKAYSVAAGVRYMIMAMIGSGLLLLGICFLYDITGQLLMQPGKEAVAILIQTGEYRVPLLLAIAMISVGVAIKSALWPFHTWLPQAYGYSTTASSAMLSSVISKGYIFLLIKFIVRVFGVEYYGKSGIVHVLFIFGIMAMIFGSIEAIKQKKLRRMVAYSSIAQIGYIFMGIGMASIMGLEASCLHIFAHASAKSLAFISAAGLIKASGSREIEGMYGAGYKNKIAGLGFVFASLSMIGIPGFAGFISKMVFAQAALADPTRVMPVLAALAISTLLNAIYFMRVVLVIYTPLSDEQKEQGMKYETVKNYRWYGPAIILSCAFNLMLGLFCSNHFIEIVSRGLELFG